ALLFSHELGIEATMFGGLACVWVRPPNGDLGEQVVLLRWGQERPGGCGVVRLCCRFLDSDLFHHAILDEDEACKPSRVDWLLLTWRHEAGRRGQAGGQGGGGVATRAGR